MQAAGILGGDHGEIPVYHVRGVRTLKHLKIH